MAYRNLYSETQVTDLLEQILSAVDYLHSRHIVHLDLKSDNMLVTDRNVVKIVDLGSAQPFTPGQALNIEHIKEMTDNKGISIIQYYDLEFVAVFYLVELFSVLKCLPNLNLFDQKHIQKQQYCDILFNYY